MDDGHGCRVPRDRKLAAVDIAPRDKPADDLQDLIRTTQSDLARAGEMSSMRKDPYRLTLAALSATLGVFGRSITRWERAVADVIAARDPLPEEDWIALKAALLQAVENGAFSGVRKEAQRMVRTLDRRLSVQIGLAVGAAYVLGALSLLAVLFVLQLGPFSRAAESQDAWQKLMQTNPDPRPALSLAEIRTDRTGRRYYAGLALWLDPARPPSASQ
jgi:hypothetical protein